MTEPTAHAAGSFEIAGKKVARLHGYDRMARQVPPLEPLAAQAGFGEIRAGEVPPWIRYVVAEKT